MKKYFCLLLAFLCISNDKYIALIEIPPIKNQIVQTYYVQVGHRPPTMHGDLCIKWIRQMSIEVFDGKNWHYHPNQEICYLRYSQRHK